MGETFMAAVSAVPAAPGTSTPSVIVHRLLSGVWRRAAPRGEESTTGIIGFRLLIWNPMPVSSNP